MRFDKEGTRDLRELRLLNENQIKPALQTVRAWPKWLRSAGSKSNIS